MGYSIHDYLDDVLDYEDEIYPRASNDETTCHCGEQITDTVRRMCQWCSDIRCDVPSEDSIYVCSEHRVVRR